MNNNDDRKLIIKGGAMPSPPDERDYMFTDIITGIGKLPSSYVNPDLEKIEPYTLNQGTTMECVCCALAHLKWLIEIKQNGNKEMFSPSYLYGNRSSDDAYVGGCYPRCVLSQHVKFGICKFKYFPKWYSNKIIANYEYKQNKEQLDKLAYPYRSNYYYSCGTDKDTIKRAIMLCGGVMIDCPIYDTLGYDTTAIINNSSSDYIYGYHEMLAVGWDDDNNSWIVLNSYGSIYDDINDPNIKRPYMRLKYDYPIYESHTLVDDINEVKKEESNMFKDVENHWAKDTIETAYKIGAVDGYDDNTFRPDNYMTRAEVVTILDRCGAFDKLKEKAGLL